MMFLYLNTRGIRFLFSTTPIINKSFFPPMIKNVGSINNSVLLEKQFRISEPSHITRGTNNLIPYSKLRRETNNFFRKAQNNSRKARKARADTQASWYTSKFGKSNYSRGRSRSPNRPIRGRSRSPNRPIRS
jgi:hypothetical protein